MLELLIGNLIVMLSERVFNKLWVQTVLLFSPVVPLFVWGRLHTGASQEKEKEASPIRSDEFEDTKWVIKIRTFYATQYKWYRFT